MKDLHSHIKVVQLLGAASRDADVTSVALDMQGFDSCEIVVLMGDDGVTFTGTDKIEVKMTDSANDSDYAAVEAADILGEASIGAGGIIKAFTAAHAAPAVYRFGYVGGERYGKVQLDFGGTHGTPSPCAVIAILGHAHYGPVANQQ